MAQESTIDTIVSIGGGSVIDASKIVCLMLHENNRRQIYHICIPTSLSGAEHAYLACYSNGNGQKTVLNNQRLGPDLIIMDPIAGVETSPTLYLSTGMRLLIYSILWLADFGKDARFAIYALACLRVSLLDYERDSTSQKAITRLQLCTDSLIRTMGVALDGSIDVRYAAGYALGPPHGSPEAQRMTVIDRLRWKVMHPEAAVKIAKLVGYLDCRETGNFVVDAATVADATEELCARLGLSVMLPLAG